MNSNNKELINEPKYVVKDAAKAFIDACKNFFYRRNDIAAHPEAKLLAEQLQTVFNYRFSESYNYLM